MWAGTSHTLSCAYRTSPGIPIYIPVQYHPPPCSSLYHNTCRCDDWSKVMLGFGYCGWLAKSSGYDHVTFIPTWHTLTATTHITSSHLPLLLVPSDNNLAILRTISIMCSVCAALCVVYHMIVYMIRGVIMHLLSDMAWISMGYSGETLSE